MSIAIIEYVLDLYILVYGVVVQKSPNNTTRVYWIHIGTMDQMSYGVTYSERDERKRLKTTTKSVSHTFVLSIMSDTRRIRPILLRCNKAAHGANKTA